MTRSPRRLRFHKRSTGDFAFESVNILLLVLFSLSIVYPFWSTIVLSFADVEEATSLGFSLWLRNWSIRAYRFAVSDYGNMGVAYLNSAYRTAVGTFLGVIVTLLAAYPLSKRALPGRTAMTVYMLVTMFFGGGIIPTYLLVRSLHLLDTRWALILPGLAAGFHVVITRNFLMAIDPAYEDSAFIDGANHFQVLVRIIVPVSKPVIATVALWTAVGHWNAWFDALIYVRNESKVVLQVLLRRMIFETDLINWQLTYSTQMLMKRVPSGAIKAATTVLTIGPIILVYPFVQKHFVRGVFMGSLKG